MLSKGNNEKYLLEFIKNHGMKYEYDGSNISQEDNDLVWDFMEEMNNQRIIKKCSKFEIKDNWFNDEMIELEMLYRTFFNLSVEHRELTKISNAISRCSELIHLKRYIFNKMILILKDIVIDEKNKEEMQSLLGLILNDFFFCKFYLKKDNEAMEIINDMIKKLDKCN